MAIDVVDLMSAMLVTFFFCICSFFSLLVLTELFYLLIYLFFGGTGVWTQGFVAFYHLRHTSSPFNF
jgi:hypothetical protein